MGKQCWGLHRWLASTVVKRECLPLLRSGSLGFWSSGPLPPNCRIILCWSWCVMLWPELSGVFSEGCHVFQLHIADWKLSVMCNVWYRLVFFLFVYVCISFGVAFSSLIHYSFYKLFLFNLTGLAGLWFCQCKHSGAQGQALSAGSQPCRLVSMEGCLRALKVSVQLWVTVRTACGGVMELRHSLPRVDLSRKWSLRLKTKLCLCIYIYIFKPFMVLVSMACRPAIIARVTHLEPYQIFRSCFKSWHLRINCHVCPGPSIIKRLAKPLLKFGHGEVIMSHKVMLCN